LVDQVINIISISGLSGIRPALQIPQTYAIILT